MSYTQITREERSQISALLRAGMSQRRIARVIGKHPATIGRELKRNRAAAAGYGAQHAQRMTAARRILANQRFRKIDRNARLHSFIVECLREHWSPEQIAGRWRRMTGTALCHETIYRFIYAERRDLAACLRCQKGKYRRRRGTKQRIMQRRMRGKTYIVERPPVVARRARLGDWEGDLLMGREKTSALLVHCERKSGYAILDKLPRIDGETTIAAAISRFARVPHRHTVTYDNGVSFSQYRRIERQTGVRVYFAHPYRSWDKPCVENLNGLLRQFVPKKSSISDLHQGDCDTIARTLNARPRKRLQYRTPQEVFMKCCTLD